MNTKHIARLLHCTVSVTCMITFTFQSKVTYETTAGRFGDNLLSYMHAKWISYKYQIPLLYKPFIYSDQLVLHKKELLWNENDKQKYSKIISLGKNQSIIPQENNILYWVPYFPESEWELEYCTGYSGGKWDYIQVDWNDQAFIQELKKVIKPLKLLDQATPPPDRITVAIHIRRGGMYDPPSTVTALPLKFLTDDFLIEQLKRLYFLLKKHPLYVYLFTDDHNPQKLRHLFTTQFKEYDIQFACREHENSEYNNVLDDFFALQQFDCIIHSESNFSLTASKLGNYMISIYPTSFYKSNNRVIYDKITTAINQTHYKFKLIKP